MSIGTLWPGSDDVEVPGVWVGTGGRTKRKTCDLLPYFLCAPGPGSDE